MNTMCSEECNNFEKFETYDNRVIAFNTSNITDIYFSDYASNTRGPEIYSKPELLPKNDDFWHVLENRHIYDDDYGDLIAHPSIKEQVERIYDRPESDETKKLREICIARCCQTMISLSNGKVRTLENLGQHEIWNIIHTLTRDDFEPPLMVNMYNSNAQHIYINRNALDCVSVPKHVYHSGLIDYLATIYD